MSAELTSALIDRCSATIFAAVDELTALDQAIGDGDHGINMKRGFEALAGQKEELAALNLWPAVQKAGMTLVMKIGGASGPLYGSLLMGMGKAEGGAVQRLRAGVEAVKGRGKSNAGAKTMLDVLIPALECLEDGGGLDALRKAAENGLESTRSMQAVKGRASFLGARSAGHLDPGARSAQLLINSVCAVLEERT